MTTTADEAPTDDEEPLALLLAHLRSSADGLSSREAARRLLVHGPNALQRKQKHHSFRALARQVVHPLALLLWVAAALAYVSGTPVLAYAILAVIVLNALVAFVQEQQAERAVEALGEFLPHDATVLRDGCRSRVPTTGVVTGDVLVVDEGDRISERVTGELSPLERQVRRVVWLIAIVASGIGIAFLPLGTLAGLPLSDGFLFAIGLCGSDELARWIRRRRQRP